MTAFHLTLIFAVSILETFNASQHTAAIVNARLSALAVHWRAHTSRNRVDARVLGAFNAIITMACFDAFNATKGLVTVVLPIIGAPRMVWCVGASCDRVNTAIISAINTVVTISHCSICNWSTSLRFG